MMSRSFRRSRCSVADILARKDARIGILVMCLVTASVRPYATRPTLSDALRLETSIRATDLQSATQVRGRFFLRNVAATAVQLCEVDCGVTVAALTQSEVPFRWWATE
jgi:hypothetical protein